MAEQTVRYRQMLAQDPRLTSWMETLDAVDTSGIDVRLPEGSKLLDILLDMSVPHEDINAVLAHRPQPGSDAWWLLERSVSLLHRGLGDLAYVPSFPPLTDGRDPMLRYLYVHIFAAMYPEVRAWHLERGIDPEISRRSLADLGRQMTHYRRRHGVGGLNINVDWLAIHFTGKLFDLGRLQFNRATLGGTTAGEIRAGGVEIRKGDPVLGVHIPDYLGPFTPELCDESFAMAREFFPRHFPDERLEIVTYYSWLLDRHLAEYLPEPSNIIAFQKRFTINHRDIPPQDDSFFQFVFGIPGVDLDNVPQETTLQRALVTHIRNGKHWYGGVGWCRV